MADLLAVRGASVRFGGVQALSEAELTVRQGDIAALIGPNGAGKTTLLGVISGAVTPTGGSVTLAGRELAGLPIHERAAAGVVRTFQNLEIFSNMTVLENVLTGAHLKARYGLWDSLARTPRFRREEARLREEAMVRLEFVGLADKAGHMATGLPYGEQRLLELARALASGPSLLLLDEPAAGMNNKETRQLGVIIRRIRDELGVGVALVEHDMELVMDISDRITVLNFGSVLAEGTPREIQDNPEVVAAYLGED
ncbi:Sulfate/thiosulfate import ATP-binding protein CysA [Fundidesulfovibrio magnetotacticus]|uniref:Sulfate/thiosulfate import ATP-binding protein CysA n=1 Tax=Fundidesulfovibrio magnetotacticus TaxID=2730080 RepID=A0A6V8LR96_9BACT|nr:ABC transporter ATP-binding protein [Fundidesulfovibrio magnetotacticus]GFK93500.1 Sulfate/thiosulfate import ATP-binding protein CysA [Fundidesulfovibrio magnetotacticus]